MRSVPIHKLPLCDCANHGPTCRGRQEGRACMAHDEWFRTPCDTGNCPGPMSPDCCRKPHPDECLED